MVVVGDNLRAMLLRFPERTIEFPRRPLVMGIVNINDDSFSGDGTLDPVASIASAKSMAEAGADVIDFGAESARTNRAAVPHEEEIRRLMPVLEQWAGAVECAAPRDAQQIWPPVVSVNTWRPAVVEAVLGARVGVELINDMGALPDAANARLCAAAGAALLVMHSVGEPKVAHFHQRWDDVVASLERFFHEKLALAAAAGLPGEAVVLDPGIDFAKQLDDNLALFRHLGRLAAVGRPLLVPVSRKTVIGDTLGLADPADRDAGTVACIAAAMRRGGLIFRVHNVDAAWAAIRTLHAINGTRTSAGLQ
jgi:dihydropteroate synthase